jgi:outer membrane protein OmpA-like peptidoglycan-associated protein
MPNAARRAAVVLALAVACATPERVTAPPPEPEATLVGGAQLARVRCLVVAPLEDASDRLKLGEVATAALVASVDPEQTRVFPVEDLRRLFKGTSLELPLHGVSPRLAVELAEKVRADAVLYGSVEGTAQQPTGGLVVTIRLQATAGREVIFANAAPVRIQLGEQVEVALRRALLLSARPMLLKLGAPGDRTCFDPEIVRRARVMRAAPAVAAPAAAAEPEAVPPRDAAASAAATVAALPAPPPPLAPAAAVAPTPSAAVAGTLRAATTPGADTKDPRAERQAELVRKLVRGERFVLDDVEFTGRTTVFEQEEGLGDLARAMGKVPKAQIRIEVFVDASGNAQQDASASMAQAMAIVRRLVALGVARERIAQVARGGNEPVTPNFTARGRAANRRVEVVATRGP